MPSNPRMTVGELVAAFLESSGVHAAFGVISIHNMPILDAFGRRAAAASANGRPAPIRFVPARSEPGAVNMADAYARVSGGLGVAVTSTGTAAGNACGAMVEALTAGTPVLHLTGQIEVPYLDRELAYIHEAPEQLDMLRAVSKAAFRVRSAETALGTLREAVRVALTAPRGPVSVEIPIDIQSTEIDVPASLAPLEIALPGPAASELDALAERLARATRPLLWLGGGARHAGASVKRLVDLGFGVVTSVQGRGILPEDHALSLGAFNLYESVEKFYATCDAMLVVGSRLRGNETLKYKLKLPRPLYRIDADPQSEGRCYTDDFFVAGDSAAALNALADRLQGRMKTDPAFARDLAATRAAAEKLVRDGLGPYERLVAELQRAAGRDFVWVRDVTVSNSTWGNRSLHIGGPRDGVHALGGGIGQGVADGHRGCARGRRPQNAMPRRRRRTAGEHRRARHARAGKSERRRAADERSRLRRHPQHPGRALRRAPLLRRPAHAGLRAARPVDRAAVPPRPRSRTGRRDASRRFRPIGPGRDRDRHDGDRSVRDAVLRPAGAQSAGRLNHGHADSRSR